MMLPRTIDKARGLLPAAIRAITPSSPVGARGSSTSSASPKPSFLELVRRAADEAEVATVVGERVSPEKCEALNAAMKALRVADAPPEIRTLLHDLYHADDEALVLDLVIADDRSRGRPSG